MITELCKVGRTIPLSKIVDKYLVYSSQQDSQKYLASYLIFAKDVYADLNFNILTSEIREIFTIDKKLGTITLPDHLLYWLQVSVIDDKDNLIPLLENTKHLLPNTPEVVAVVGCPNPKCECDICASVKSISAITEVVTIDDIEYTNIIKTQVQSDGSIIKETCKWYATGQTTKDYVGSYGINIWYYIDTIKINGVDHTVNQSTTVDPADIQATLNALNLGTFIVTASMGMLTIQSLQNPNTLNSFHIQAGFAPEATVPFVATNPNTAVLRCNTELICKVELDENECIVDTPVNIATVNECCFPVCNHKKKDLPTINVRDGVIYFSNLNYNRVVLTYKTSGINFGIELMVPEIAEQAMMAGINYFAVKLKNTSLSVKENNKTEYELEKRKLVKVLFPMRIQELLDAARTTHIIL